MLKAAALGAVAAIAVPFILRHEDGVLGAAAGYWTVRPMPGEFGLIFSIPIFLTVMLLGWGLFKAAEIR